MTPAAEARIRAAVAELSEALIAAVQDSGHTGEPERLLSVDEAAHLAGIGRTRLYAEIGAGRIRSVTSGRRRLVPASAIAELAAGPPEAR